MKVVGGVRWELGGGGKFCVEVGREKEQLSKETLTANKAKFSRSSQRVKKFTQERLLQAE